MEENKFKQSKFLLMIIDTNNINIYNVNCMDGLDMMSDNSVDILITDPPYSTPVITSFGRKPFKNLADLSIQEFFFTSLRIKLERVLKPNARIFIFCDDKFYPILYAVFYNWLNIGLLIWDKQKIGMGNPVRKQHELIMYGSREPWEFKKSNDNSHIPSVLNFKSDTDKIHGAQKPVKLIEKLLLGFSNETDVVLDCFGGSGSTAVACNNLNRNFVGFELNAEISNSSLARLNNNIIQNKNNFF